MFWLAMSHLQAIWTNYTQQDGILKANNTKFYWYRNTKLLLYHGADSWQNIGK
jgi:hypothetical protein